MKKTMFKIALIGLLAGAFTLAQTVKHFGAWILVPITAAFIGSLCGNYLMYEYRRACNGKQQRKSCNATAYSGNSARSGQAEGTQTADVFIISEKTL